MIPKKSAQLNDMNRPELFGRGGVECVRIGFLKPFDILPTRTEHNVPGHSEKAK